MDQPTADEVREWAPSEFDWDAYGLGGPFGTEPDPLDQRIVWSVGELYAVTGRTLASITLAEEVGIAQRVLVTFTITQALGGGKAALKVLEKPWLKSFTAGSYSETRFGPSELSSNGTQPPYPGGLWALLWALMTEEKRDDWMWRLTGRRPAATVFAAPDWGHHGHFGPVGWGPGIDTW